LDSLDENTKYKIELNLGLTLLGLHKNDRAAEYLLNLNQFSGTYEGRNSFISIGYLLTSQNENAIAYAEKALE